MINLFYLLNYEKTFTGFALDEILFMVYTPAGKSPELYVTAIGTWKKGAVFCPLFAAFYPNPIYQRLRIGSVHPEIGKFGRNQGLRKILPQAYG